MLSPDFYFLSGREIVMVSSLSLEFLPIWLAEYAVCGLIVSNYYTRYCSGVKRRIPEHTPVVTFVSCRVDSVMLDTDRDSQESDFAVSLGYVVVIFVIFRR